MRSRVLALAVAAVAGCGGSARPAPAPSATATAAPAPLLTFQRNGGAVATLDVLTVHRDGSADLDKRYGGAGRRRDSFALTAAMLGRIRRGLREVPATPPRPASSPGAARDRGTLLLNYRGVAYPAVQGKVPQRLRKLFGALNAVIDGDGRR